MQEVETIKRGAAEWIGNYCLSQNIQYLLCSGSAGSLYTIARTVLEDIWGGARRSLWRSSSLSQESGFVQLALRGT
jgi:hypothetical protein